MNRKFIPTSPETRRQNTRRAILWAGALAIIAVVMAVMVPMHDHALTGIVGTGLLGFAGAYIDAQCVFSDAQALTATAYSTNAFDTAAAGNKIDIGEPVCVAFSVDVAAKTSGTDETYQIALIQSANSDLSSEDVLIITNTTFMSRSFFTAGKKFYLPFPPGLKTKRYLGVKYTLGGTTPTVTISADLRPLSMIQNDNAYADGLTISS